MIKSRISAVAHYLISINNSSGLRRRRFRKLTRRKRNSAGESTCEKSLLTHPLPTSPQFFAHPRRAPLLPRFFTRSMTRRSGVYLEVPQRNAGLIDPHSLHISYVQLSRINACKVIGVKIRRRSCQKSFLSPEVQIRIIRSA